MSKSIARHLLLCVLLLCAKGSIFVTASCNTCSVDNNLACVSETQFKVCVNGSPTGSAASCPTGYVCSTQSTSICEASGGDGVVGDCTACNTCDSTKTFACTGIRTYALCLGTTTVSDLGGTCAPYHVCSIDYEYICGNATLGIEATCPSIDDTVTTTVAPSTAVSDPAEYCATVQQNGRFPVGNDLTTTCKQYVYCFVNNSVWSGALYYCPGATYFNSSSRYCTANVPARCLGTTQVLSLRSVDLNLGRN
ncbi:uncharacterized protein LOC128860348 [Anastrepha ludens]|uniref:uncharacterized protein LOC128860348 n=1 Tax=Anastrepha ludens TaxID=28586 RepID=UPI0023AFE34D|nr:uncharacterized protein LOC128860348 [Anastrepha ludens]